MKRLSLFFLIGMFFCAGCYQREPLRRVDFNDTIKQENIPPVKNSELTVCVGSMITPEEGFAYYKKLLDYIGYRMGMKINFCEKKTYAEVNTLLKDGSIDVAFVCGGPYVKGHDEFGLRLLAAPVVGGMTSYYSYIIVAKDSGISSLDELKGARFAFVDPLSNTGRLIPIAMVRELGEDPRHFFRESVYTYSHDSSILAVARGIVDGAAVDSLIWDYLDRKGSPYTRKTAIIRKSAPYGIPPVVTRSGLDKMIRKKLRDILLHMHDESAGKDILKNMFIDRFVEVDDSLYDSIRALRLHFGE